MQFIRRVYGEPGKMENDRQLWVRIRHGVILQFMVFKDEPMPKIENVIEDVDVNALDQGHVVPDMGVVAWRGVWFPIYYQGF